MSVGAAISNAVADALGIEPAVLPLTPSRVWDLICRKEDLAPTRGATTFHVQNGQNVMAPTRGATTFHVQNGQNVMAPLVGARQGPPREYPKGKESHETSSI